MSTDNDFLDGSSYPQRFDSLDELVEKVRIRPSKSMIDVGNAMSDAYHHHHWVTWEQNEPTDEDPIEIVTLRAVRDLGPGLRLIAEATYYRAPGGRWSLLPGGATSQLCPVPGSDKEEVDARLNTYRVSREDLYKKITWNGAASLRWALTEDETEVVVHVTDIIRKMK